VINGLCCAAVIVAMPLFLKLYSLSSETIELARILVLLHCGMGIICWPASFTLPNVLRAANDVKFPMVVSILSMIVFRILFSYILGVRLGWGAIGVWIAMIVDWFCRIACFVWRYFSGRWKIYAARA
jgi:Na+-driven multidrug efflux pump